MKVVIIESDDSVRMVLTFLMEHLGHTVVAATAKTCSEVVKKHRPDYVILEHSVVSDKEAQECLKVIEELNSKAIVLTTSSVDTLKGNHVTLRKPFGVQDLEQLLT